MELVTTIMNAFENPERMKQVLVDGAAHLGSGFFLAKNFFPEGGKVKTAIRSLVGCLPDIDYLMPGLVHRSPTHGWAAPLLPFGYSLFEEAKGRALAMSSLGVVSHLFIDYGCPTVEEKITYLGVLGSGLMIQKYQEMREKDKL